jgi:hypothetical protein
MRDALGPGTILGYCTNVHAGTTLAQVQANLERYAVAVKARVSPDQPMGVGLWFPNAVARLLIESGRVEALRSFMKERGLEAYTLNGFPYGDFHEAAVKHAVYRPDWSNPERFAYTNHLARVLTRLLPDSAEGSISTLPVGWREAMSANGSQTQAAGTQLLDLVHQLARVELDADKLIHVDLEPEPGCYLDRAADVAVLYQRHLLGRGDDVSVRAYLRVCHDICHSAVMFEDQAAALAAYRAAGIAVGKMQISSAVRVPFDEYSPSERVEALTQLRGFDETRYLHQTMIRTDDGKLAFFEDLPLAIQAVEQGEIELRGEWRVHFHVPVFLERSGLIQTTQSEIAACLRAIRPGDGVHHFEVETYAWNVLPPELQTPDLADGIARELLWVKDQAANGAFR